MYNRLDSMSVIRECANRHTLVDIQYVDSSNRTTGRLIEPYELKNNGIYAYCLDKEGIRNFKISNIISAENTGIKFTPRWSITL